MFGTGSRAVVLHQSPFIDNKVEICSLRIAGKEVLR